MPVKRFVETFGPGDAVFLASAPGRVNLIGEHTDYNGGYVLPMAIDRTIRLAFRPWDRPVVELASVNYGGRESFRLDGLRKRGDAKWLNYPQGVALVLQEAGHRLRGFQGVVEGDVPVGAGLSSSAAFEVACILAFSAASGLDIDRREMARLCQAAENRFVGVRCGIMDMYVSLFAERNHAVFIDCTTMTHEQEPLDGSAAAVVVCDTGVAHELAQSEYNTRRGECESALAKLRTRLPDARTYKDIGPASFRRHADVLTGAELARARHVVSENQRVLDSVEALRRGDLARFGELMNASHESLRGDYAVSCAELDLMVSLAREVKGCLGSRMTGGGFGGCTVSLVAPDAVEEFRRRVADGYAAALGRRPPVHVCHPAGGARVECAETHPQAGPCQAKRGSTP
jgi:galactokinase